MSLVSPDKHSQHPEASQSPLLLDNPVQLHPTVLQDREGNSSAWNTQGQDASLQSPGLEPQSLVGPGHDAQAPQERLTVASSHLGNARSSESDVRSMRHSCLEKGSDISQLSSGYEGDEENSELSLAGSGQIVRWHRRLSTQASGTHPPSQADSTRQTGGETQHQPARRPHRRQQGQQPEQPPVPQPGQQLSHLPGEQRAAQFPGQPSLQPGQQLPEHQGGRQDGKRAAEPHQSSGGQGWGQRDIQ